MKIFFLRMIYVSIAVIILFAFQSCNDKELTDMNKNPNVIEYAIPEYTFTAAVHNSIPGQSYRALGGGLQYFAVYREVNGSGDKFYDFGGTAGSFNVYDNQWNRLLQLNAQIPGPENVNKRAAIEILRILAFHQATDVIGDMPYTEAMKGLGNLKPRYDTQKSIYTAMLNELETALKSMDPGKPNVFGTADPYFKGDISKWKKFGYTLMMRLGMRLSDVEPATAKTWVEKAVSGGVMSVFTDIAYRKFANIASQTNPRVDGLIAGDFVTPGGDNVFGGKWSAKFIDHLKNSKDPRLPILSVVWVPSGTTYVADNTVSKQRGMINGSLNTKPTDFDTYSEPSLLYLDRGSPIITMGPAEAYFLLAEAALRGWNVGTTPKAAYENGVRAAMAQWALWLTVAPHSGVISGTAVDTYLANNPYLTGGTFDQQLEQISTQKWVSMLGDDFEIYSNWRRTKYPVFNYKNWKLPNGTLSYYPGNVTGGKMWRRFSIPNEEKTLNPVNYFEAIKRQNFSEDQVDLLQGRMWWDVGPGTGQAN